MNYYLTVLQDHQFWVGLVVYLEGEPSLETHSDLRNFVDEMFGVVSFTYQRIWEENHDATLLQYI